MSLRLAVKVAFSFTVALGMAACSGSGSSGDSGSSGTPLSISGGFSSLSLAPLNVDNGLFTPMAASDYTMICSMLVDPFTSAAKALESDGSFTLSIAGASGKPIGCMLTKSGKIAAVFEFQAASSGFSGAAGGSTFTPNADSTQLNFPLNMSVSDGVVTVSTAAITENGSTEPSLTWLDPTGTWSITKACQNKLNDAGDFESQCLTPQGADDIPSSVYLKQVTATNGTDTRTGLAIWKDEASRNACGGVEGAISVGNGYSAVGGWNSAFTGHTAIDLSTTGAVATAAGKSTAPTWGGSTTVCNKTVTTPGTTKCSQVDFTGGGWGMGEEACRLYCVISAISQGGDDPYYDFGSDQCPYRYNVHWHNTREFHTDVNFGSGSPQTGVFADGACGGSFDGCKEGSVTLMEPDDRGPNNRFMFGELFVNGNVGTLIEKNHEIGTYTNSTFNGTIDCGGTMVEKLTLVYESTTKATVTLERNFVPDPSNSADCANNQDYQRREDDEESITMTLVKQ